MLDGRAYLVLTGMVLVLAAGLVLTRRNIDAKGVRGTGVAPTVAVAAGAATGFLSGLTGVGGGVFLAPLLIALGWASPRRVAGLSAPFILGNSVVALAGTSLTGQMPASATTLYVPFALAGAVAGTAVGLRWMSQAATRYVIAAILVIAGGRLLTL